MVRPITNINRSHAHVSCAHARVIARRVFLEICPRFICGVIFEVLPTLNMAATKKVCCAQIKIMAEFQRRT